MAFPRFFRRLFANEGAGPLLRGDILPFGDTAETACRGNDARLTRAASTSATVDAWRLSWIGVPRWWRSTKLPPHHVWADGSLVLFEDWPEFKACYDAGGFEGMLLPPDSDSAVIANNLGKWVEHPNSLGLYTPSLGGQFFRNWTLGEDKEAGAWGRDEIRDITGWSQDFQHVGGIGAGGAMSNSSPTGFTNVGFVGSGSSVTTLTFSSAACVPTGTQNVPQHVWQPSIIYLGIQDKIKRNN